MPHRFLVPLGLHNLITGEAELNARIGMDDIVDTGMAGPKASQQRTVGRIYNRSRLQTCDIPLPETDPAVLLYRSQIRSIQNAARGNLLRQIQILFRQKLRICRHWRPYIHQGAEKLFLPRTVLWNHNAAILRHLLLHSPDQIPEAFFLGLVTLIFQITSPL